MKAKKLITRLFFGALLMMYSHSLFSQTVISGTVNNYVDIIKVTDPGCEDCATGEDCWYRIEVSDASGFNPGDRVLIVQMKGATIDVTNSASGGQITDIGNAGNYEFFLVGKVDYDNKIIYPRGGLKRTYDNLGLIQLVKVPTYSGDVEINNDLIADAWDPNTGRGGIVAIFVDGTLTMNADIDVHGKGYQGVVVNTNGSPDNCSIDPATQMVKPSSNSDVSPKGQGIVVDDPNTNGGRAPRANGGGGGVSGDTGGGGGSNFGAGGNGGDRWCNAEDSGNPVVTAGGIGGTSMVQYINTNRIYFGGAGGAGFVTNGNSATAANGGGLVVIRANKIICNNHVIDASGSSPSAAGTGIDGGGGGGGGGTVAFEIKEFEGSLTINVSGGDGQDLQTSTLHGPGGGGGGGAFLYNLPQLPSGINVVATGGEGGEHLSGKRNGSTDGTDGGIVSYFDFIYSDVDSDFDGISDECDLDTDNDGILDSDEDGGSGFDPSKDADGDGIPNYKDSDDNTPGFPPFIDTNNDWINDIYDRDKDHIPDFQDLDSDNDGFLDAEEAGGIADPSGILANYVDNDLDGLNDNVDPDMGGTPLLLPDDDNDSAPDFVDLDSDNDGISDAYESRDKIIETGIDTDKDGIDDAYDADQGGSLNTKIDHDGDSIYDMFDIDSDNDGIADYYETSNIEPLNSDADNDGIDDAYDIDNTGGTDADGDWMDDQSIPGDTDGDGLDDFLDIDSDGDGIVDNIEGQATASYIAPTGTDTDQDGLDDAYDTDNGGYSTYPVDTDGDLSADYKDLDSDEDGESDMIEAYDINRDGISDILPASNDTDNDGLDDNFDDVNGKDATDGGEKPTDYPDVDDPGDDRDWRQNLPRVYLSLDKAIIQENAQSATFTVSLSQTTYLPVTVSLSYDGTAGVTDYNVALGTNATNANTIVIPAGQLSGSITITSVDDAFAEDAETVIAEIASVDYAKEETDQKKTITISDNDGPGITVSTISNDISEDGQTATFTIVLNSAPTNDVSISISSNNPAEGQTSVNSVTFNSTNWNVPKVITVTPVDDIMDEPDRLFQIVFGAASSLDTDYKDLSINSVNVTNIDNDEAPTISFDTTSSNGSESVNSVNVKVNLSTPSAYPITVDYSVSGSANSSDHGLINGTLSIAAGSNSGFITISSINDDKIDELDETVILTLSNPSFATLGTNTTHTYTIIDNDVAGITITQSGTSNSTSEDKTTDSFTIKLDSQPTSDVVINITGVDASEGSLDKTQLTFTSANWNTAQTVTVTGVDDDLVDGDISYSLSIAVDNATSDDTYDNISETVSVTNTDNDVAGITITQSGTSNSTSEDKTTDSFTVKLDSQPTSDVVINITGVDASEGSLDKTQLTFTSANWNTAQTVTVTGVDDDLVDGDISYSLSIAVDNATSDDTYDNISETVSVTNTDNDVAGITITQSGTSNSTSEDKTTDSFTVKLDSQPTSDVVINITGVDASEGSLDKTQLTFTSGNWNTAQTVTVTGVDDDLVDGDISYSLSIAVDNATSDDTYDNISETVSVTNTDNDVAGITITQSGTSNSTSEDKTTDSFTVKLDSQPTSNVVINITGVDASEGSLDKTQLTFTSENWNTAQTVTVTGVDDNLVDGDITYTLSVAVNNATSDNTYDNISETVSVTNTDNDAAGIIIYQTDGDTKTTEDGSQDSFSVVLRTEPTSDVVINITGLDASEGSLDKTQLTFTSANWNTPQTVTVTGVDDVLVDGDITYDLSIAVDNDNTDDTYDNISETVPVTNTDNDAAGIIINQTDGDTKTTEDGSQDSFSVVLRTEPTSDVVINITGVDASEGSLDKTQLTFTSANWNTAQTVTVTGVDDDLVDGDITYTLSVAVNNATSDNTYDNISETVSVTNTDNDAAGIIINQTDGDTKTTEDGSQDSFSVVLRTEPTSDVVINITGLDASEGSLDKTQLTFTSANWNTPQTVTVTGADDVLVDGDITYDLSIAVDNDNTDDTYDNISETVPVTNTDNDAAGIIINQTDGDTKTSEDGSQDSFSVVLRTEPTSDVVINITGLDASEGSLDKTQLTFTSANWNTPQTVTVTGVDDVLVDGDITYDLSIAVDNDNTDDTYDNISETVPVTNTDNDAAGIIINQTDGDTKTSEDGSQDSFSVVLRTEPTSDVVINITGVDDSEGSLDKSQLTFTSTNWNTAQTVTVTGVDDELVDGDITYSLSVAVNNDTSDDTYDNISETVSVINTDNDAAGIIINQTDGDTKTSEDGNSDSFSVVLRTEPTSDVVINITGLDASEGSLDKTQLTFTSANWNTPQTVTVTGVDDELVDGDITYDLSIAVDNDNSDDTYDNISETVSVINTDNDAAGIIINQTDGDTKTSEDGNSDSFSVVLRTEPTSDVVINITGLDASEGSLDKTQLTFTSANWNTPQTVTVTGVDDELVDGDITYDLSIAVDNDNSDDTYDNISETVSVTNTDNDAAGIIINQTDGDTKTTEDGSQDSFSVVLRTEPTSDVVINITGVDASEGSLNRSQLTFTSANWDTPQTVTITGVNDYLVDGDISYTLSIAVNNASSDDTYDGIDENVSVTNMDNDVAGIIVTETNGYTETSEDENADYFYVVLRTKPTSDVQINITGIDASEGLLDKYQLTFTSTNWSTAQMVTVKGMDDDLVDGDITYTLSVAVDNATSDDTYDDIREAVSVTNTDNDLEVTEIIANDDVAQTDMNTDVTINVLENDINVNTSEANITITSKIVGGTAVINSDNTITVVPSTGFTGEISLTYEVCNAENVCASAKITVTVNAINQAPVAIDDQYSVVEGNTLEGASLLNNDSDPDGDDLTINITPIAIPDHGSLIIHTDGTFTYTPDEEYIGEDSFTYEVCDNGTPQQCSSATVFITVEKWDNDGDGISNEIEGDVDTDGDGTLDRDDTDSDNDGILDEEEGNIDSDGDSTANYKDTDSDDDGIPDEVEGTDDADDDGLPNYIDPDSDGDGLSDAEEGTDDYDNDGLPNYLDDDSDNDGVSDAVEGDVDTDQDGMPDYLDEDSDNDGVLDINEGEGDCDNDGIENRLDPDRCYGEYELELFEGFSPNNDGDNDTYNIPWLYQFNQVSIEVFNRWGNVVYKQGRYQNNWNGESNVGFSIGKDLPVGTYYYIIKVHDINKTLTGYIYLNR
nr:Ig-like domain-containing protein [uncultured Carboxylicivirga sp.]